MWCNTAGVPLINSFAEAKFRFENTKPIRGHKDKIRPLGYRNKHNMASIDMPDADTVVLKYYGETFVTWKSDDSFAVSNTVYNSAYSATHLPSFLPRRWETRWDKCRMTIGNKGKFYIIPHDTTFHFVKAGDDYELVNKPIANAIRKRRGAERKLLEKCAPFFDWLTVVTSVNSRVTGAEALESKHVLREAVGVKSIDWYREKVQSTNSDKGMSSRERQKLYEDYRMCEVLPIALHHTWMGDRRFHTASAEMLMEWVEGDDAEKWVLAMNIIADRMGHRRYMDRSLHYDLTISIATKFVTEIARHVHRNAIFYPEQLEDGVVPTRNNEVYFRSHSFTF